MIRSLRVPLVLLPAWLLLTAPALALPPERPLARARLEYRNQEYQRVIEILAPLVGSPARSRAETVERWELLGLSQLILGDEQQARAAFEKLLELEPAHQLRDPSGSPKLRGFFERIRAAMHRMPADSPTLAVPVYQPQPWTSPVNVARPRAPSIFRRFWFWTAVAAVAAGTATAVVLGTRQTLPDGNLAPGVVKLR